MEYSDTIISSHQQIVQAEESLHLTDGARIIELQYTNKYLNTEKTPISYSFGIIEFVVKILKLISFNTLKEANTIFDPDKNDAYISYVRTRDFLIYNSNTSLRIVSEEIIEKYFDVLQDKAISGKTVNFHNMK